MPGIRLLAYRLMRHSRRTRVILIGDEIFTKVGGYVLGNFLTSVIVGAGIYVWLLILGVPYPVLPAMLVALLDLIPVIGSALGGAIVSLVWLTMSLLAAIAIGVLVAIPAAAAVRLQLPEVTFRRLDSA
jgi:predicted PurR-regulated permease PerM